MFGPHSARHFSELAASIRSAMYCFRHLSKVRDYADKTSLLAAMLAQAQNDGLFLEFGVATGQTINTIASLKPDLTIYGFDSFQGLPEDWRKGWPKGTFAQASLPKVRDNCELIVGMFEKTLPDFLSSKQKSVSFIHMDCDLYSSAKTVLECCASYVKPGTVIVFDEFFNYADWQKHEFLAWQDYCRAHHVKAKPVGLVSSDMQLAFMIESI